MISGLKQLVDLYATEKKRYNLQEDLDLTKNQYNNFQKLQYFDLASRNELGWIPTNRGIEFVKGKKRIYDPVLTFDGIAVGARNFLWSKVSKKPKLKYAKDVKVRHYKRKEDYIETI